MDRRIRKSQEALYTAFLALVARRGYEGITVQDIVEEADVGRTTFYAHFRTKEDLLRHGFDRLRAELDVSLQASSASDVWGFLLPLLEHARRHSGIFRALAAGSGGRLAEAEFRNVVEERVADAMRLGRQSVEVTMIVGALLAGIHQLLAASLNNDTQMLVVDIVRRMAREISTHGP